MDNLAVSKIIFANIKITWTKEIVELVGAMLLEHVCQGFPEVRSSPSAAKDEAPLHQFVQITRLQCKSNK